MHTIKKRSYDWFFIGRLKQWWFQRRIKKFEKFMFPVIKNMSTDFNMADIMSVQPMSAPVKNFFTEYYDLGNPRIGQIFHDGDKTPTSCHCCIRDMWSKIWTPNGWVCEKNDSVAYEQAVKVYNSIYKAEIKKEEEAWNKENGITSEDFHIPMSFRFDSRKSI